MKSSPAYGTTRQRQASVSYLEIERAALEVLASGRRPSIEILRKHLGKGSPATILEALRRFWKELGVRAAGDSAALTRLPVEIAEFADGLWQRALALAAQAAKQEDNAARQRLQQLQLENEVRAQSATLREREWDTHMREREAAFTELRQQLSMVLNELAADRATMRAQVARITELSSQLEACRQQLGASFSRVITRHRKLVASHTRSAKPDRSPTRRAKLARGRGSTVKRKRKSR
jgi:hypothetical protein